MCACLFYLYIFYIEDNNNNNKILEETHPTLKQKVYICVYITHTL